jgi:hypothetical protein
MIARCSPAERFPHAEDSHAEFLFCLGLRATNSAVLVAAQKPTRWYYAIVFQRVNSAGIPHPAPRLLAFE